MNENISKTQHEDCLKNEFRKKVRMLQKALYNYNKRGRYTTNQDKKLAGLDFKELKPFYQQIKDPFKGHWDKEYPKKYQQQLKNEKNEIDNCSLK